MAQAEISLNPSELPAPKPAPTPPPAAPTTNVVLQLRVDLVDGSILIGRPLTTTLPVQTSFAGMSIPFTAIDSIEFGKNNAESKLKLKNGDLLKGTISLKSLTLDTCLGRVDLKPEHLARLRVTAGGAAGGGAELRFRGYIDGADEIHIRGNSLWYVHRSWKRPGDGDNGQEPTFLNDKPWKPTWRSNNSEKYTALDPAFPTVGDPQISLEKKQARGELRVMQQPSESNGYEAIIFVDDSNVPSQDWYEFTLRWSR